MNTTQQIKTSIVKTITEILLRAVWFPALVFGISLICLFFNMDKIWPSNDIPMHFFGGVSITYFFWKSISICEENGLIHPLQNRVKIVFSLSLTGTTTVLWELAEYALDHTLRSNLQFGLEDTLLDMLLGIIGGIVFVGSRIAAVSAASRNRQNDLSAE